MCTEHHVIVNHIILPLWFQVMSYFGIKNLLWNSK